MFKSLKSGTQKLSAAVVGGFVAGMAGSAHASGTLDDMVSSTTDNTDNIAQLVNVVAYGGGAVLLVSGITKLKKYADNPGQEDMSKGVARLLAGAGLVALPAITDVVLETTAVGDGNAPALGTFGNTQ